MLTIQVQTAQGVLSMVLPVQARPLTPDMWVAVASGSLGGADFMAERSAGGKVRVRVTSPTVNVSPLRCRLLSHRPPPHAPSEAPPA